MCGRLACGLQPDDICTSCCYQEKGHHGFVKPEWKTFFNQGKIFKPSFNICPTDLAPILISGSHINASARCIVPMIFGLIAPWEESSQSKKYSTINCRIETIQSSKLYKPLFEKRQRCVVICMGFFEWKSKKNEAPYFIHAQQPSSVLIDDPTTWNIKCTPENKGFQVLKIAGLFDVHKDSLNENNEKFSFTIITKEADSDLSWLHHRMPAIIDSEEKLHIWLNCQQYDSNEALQQLLFSLKLDYYQVSTTVNKITNKDIICIKKNKNLNKETFLQKWLNKNSKRKGSESTDDDDDVQKKFKKEN